MGAGVAIGGVVSLLSMSSPQAIWIMVNQFQLLMLLPLTDVYMPKEIEDYLSGMSFTSFNFDFLPLSSIPKFKGIFEYFGFEQNDQYLQGMGIEYGSAFLNQISLFAMMCAFLLIHSIIMLLYNLVKHDDSTKKYKVMSKLVDIFTFAIYYRTLVEAYQIMLLSSLLEISKINFSDASRVISFCLAFCLLTLCVGVLSIMVVEWYRSRNPKIFEKQRYFKEVF
jgi:hypothetical protein